MNNRQFDLLKTGNPPFQPHSETSREAAEAIKPKRGTLQRRVFAFIESRGVSGATDEEIQLGLELNGSTVRPRRGELAQRRLIVQSGKTRKTKSGRNATVWVVSDPTQEKMI